MRIISFANFKGGQAKTTSTVNVGAALNLSGKSVLLVDLDPQFNLTQSFGLEPSSASFDLFHDKTPAPEEIRPGLKIIPSSIELITAEIELAGRFKREYILSKSLEAYKGEFDFILLDCPPSLGILSINAFMSSDLIFVPIEAEFLALKGFAVLSSALDRIGLEIDRVFITKYDQRKILNRTVKDQLFEHLKGKVFQTVIRENISLAEAPANKQDIFTYAPGSYGAEDYKNLTTEILKDYE